MDRNSSGTNLDNAVAFIVRRTARHLRVHLNRFLLSNNFEGGPEQWLILTRIMQAGSLTQSELTEGDLDDRANISRQIRSLLALGYISKRNDADDARRKIICLTKSGAKIVEKILPKIESERRRIYGEFSNEEIETLVVLLEKLEKAVK